MLNLRLTRGAENATGVRTATQVHSRQLRFVIGRDPKCDWPIADRALALSARHCEIVQVDGRQVLRDLSTNGTFVNGGRQRLGGDHVLADGDRITLGSYQIEVDLVPDAGQPAAAATLAPTRIVRRGGDPAAMVDTDWQRAPNSAHAPALEMNSGFTRISKPWLDTSAEDPPVFVTLPNVGAPSPDAPVPRAPSRRTAAPKPGEVLQALAAGLGVASEELGSDDPIDAALRVSRLLRVAMFALHHQLSLQSRQVQSLGSRVSVSPPGSQVARLRLAGGPQQAVGALLRTGAEAEATLVRAHGELGLHMQRVLAAFGAACWRLGEQLDPAAIAQGVPGEAGQDEPARLWQAYCSLWPAVDQEGEDSPWAAGFVGAAAAYLAAAYDEQPPSDQPNG